MFPFLQKEITALQISSGDLINEITVKYNYDHAEGKYLSALTKRNPLSQLMYRVAKETYELQMVQSTRVAEKVADAVLKTSSIPEIIASFSHNLSSIHVEVGDEVTITHLAGLQAAGWINAEAVVIKKDMQTSQYTVAMKSSGSLYVSELVTLSQVAAAGMPGITLQNGPTGKVFIITSETPPYNVLPGVDVTISGVTKRTDQNGAVRFDLLPGTYTMYLTGAGYVNKQYKFSVS